MLDRLLRLGIAAVVLVAIGIGALAWRLEQGPLEVAWLARQVERSINAGGRPARLEIGAATLAWAGWREGHRSPLELTLHRARLVEADGSVRADLPDAALSLSLAWLFRGHVAPRALEMRGLALRAYRTGEGAFHLDLGAPGEDAAAEGAEGGAAALLPMLAELMRPPSEATPLAALRRVRLLDARLDVADAQLGRAWSADIARLSLTRREGGGLDLGGFGAVRLGGERVALRIDGTIDGATQQGEVALALPEVRPAALARAAPLLAPLAAVDAEASAALVVRLQGLDIPSAGRLRLDVGAGAIDMGRHGRLPLAGLFAEATLAEGVLRLDRAVLRPAGPRGSAAVPPVIGATATLRRDGPRWRAEASVTLDRLSLADLGHYWPAGIASGARVWMVENVTQGTARDGTWRIALSGDAAAGDVVLDTFEGEATAEDATVHWLRPIPPAEGAHGTARFTRDAIEINVGEARQGGTRIAVQEARIRFDLAAEPETAEMEIVVAGPLPEAWTLLRHPRLGLFSRRPPPVERLDGTLREARLSIAFPLIADLPVERLVISATGRSTEVRVPRALLGRTLERGAFEFSADTEGLRVTGTATLAGIPLRIRQEADFRAGPAGQVVARETVTGRAEAQQLAALGLDPRPLVEGPVGLDIRSETRRNGQARVALRADLTAARLAVEPLAWSKPPGVAANGEALLLMQNGRLRGIEGIRITAPDALLRGVAGDVQDNLPRRIEVTQGNLGRSRFTGEFFPPQGRGAQWRMALRGPVLDLGPALAAPTGDAADGPGGAAPGASVDARFDRVLLRDDRALTGVVAEARVDGAGVVQQATMSGRVAGGGVFAMRITPEGARRRLRLTSDDGGALLRAFGVLRTVQGGRLSVDAAYAHARPGAPLAGSAELEDFAVREAPALAKLLQAMTVFGVFEALDQRGLSFASLTAPFVLTPGALVLDDARAFSVSLGITAKGRIDRRRETIDMEGTIVPAYVFNSLLGRIPLLGRVFSPEAGGGLFAATYRMRGPLSDPTVSVNPLAALTPGFLRGIFGLGQDAPAADERR
ncbi:AsmA-like C-terminal region-containing protein [Roseomonas sp. HF4]|uniref:YhdP family protein n=1 Tax=Roseomonas sp. HF4 TaxID=2562313 RepID=UPI0010BF767F|nr:AsmA-like C-terminal region-containing protein [Roseomonas sp. HF4]